MKNIKYIPQSDNRYIIFSDGRVLSLKYGRWSARRFLKPSIGNHGYPVLNILIGGKKQPYLLHRLLAESFISNPKNKPDVNHRDGNKTNFNLDNLEWVTESENFKHAVNNGLYKGLCLLGKIGALCKNSRPILQKTLSGELVREWDSQMSASRDLNISQPRISTAILKRRVFFNHLWELKS